ncbi:hypothetical protein HELRODRAFT_110566 [Helobdella robusta]|uniref:Endothelin-converting enzyme 1 n=1 Tax=Helobdella robusta TaxID=6412 RepID=T1EF32_HELRO|nr:hypothetical protein HELRODRAFT_110566 [Helobdella robusta]ESO07738.1 hypothetical protein HELRODRAFT_110566 [Helobdella robusta]
MSNQKYRRTNFEEEDSSRVELPSPSTNFDPMVGFQQYKLNFWRRRSTLEKVLALLLLLSLLIIAILAVVIHLKSHTKSPGPEGIESTSTCLKKSCITAASSILNSIDEKVDPCNDFYEFACGTWMKSNPIPNGHAEWDTFTILKEENNNILKRYLEAPLNESYSESQTKLKKFYMSCMDPKEEIEKIGSKPVVYMMQKMGGWSVSDIAGKWNESDWDFMRSTELAMDNGIPIFFSLSVSEDEKDSNKNILRVEQQGFNINRDFYLNKSIDNDKLMSAYLKYMTSLSVLMGGEENETRELMRELLLFEMDLAEITTPYEERRDDEKMYNKQNITYLQEIAPFINWLDYINGRFSKVNITINESEPIIVPYPEYFVKLNTLINNTLHKENGKRMLQNYIVWNVMEFYSQYLNKPFRKVRKDFRDVLTGVVGEREKWRNCVYESESIMGFVLSTQYIQEEFNEGSRTSAVEMVKYIRKAFIDNLPNLAWMDEATRKAAIDKAEAVVEKIGFPEFVLNTTELDIKYAELDIHEDQYFLNCYKTLINGMNTGLAKLRKDNDKMSWSMTPQTVNAYYTPNKNEIVFPAGILQLPFYHKDYPKSLNFGAMGVIMGHELTHGFDDQGRRYDKTGIMRMWWNEKIIELFQERTQCLVDQYSNYSINGDNLKGKMTLGENIADNGGLKSAYYAYEQYIADRTNIDPQLPGVPYNSKQLFFISFAQVWCANSNAADVKNSIMIDTHSPPRFRVIGSVTNFPEFAKQFNCPAGSPMNPLKKCEVW